MNTDQERIGDWIQTYSGGQVWPLDPRPEEIFIEDIAHALAHQCRFSGHCEEFYSVAQHSVLVSEQLHGVEALWGLLHDASEAYLVDLPRPLKRFGEIGRLYKEAETKLMKAICIRFGLPEEEPEGVRYFDNALLTTEQRDLMKKPPQAWSETTPPLSGKIYPVPPSVAEWKFMERFWKLNGLG